MFFICLCLNGRVSDRPLRMRRHQSALAHNSTLHRRQYSFMYCLCSKQNCLLCAYECDFDDIDKITIFKTGKKKKKVIILSLLNLVSDFVKCNHPIGKPHLKSCIQTNRPHKYELHDHDGSMWVNLDKQNGIPGTRRQDNKRELWNMFITRELQPRQDLHARV
jgi:hypothetical protein